MFDMPPPIVSRHQIKIGKFTVTWGLNTPRYQVVLIALLIVAVIAGIGTTIAGVISANQVEKTLEHQTYSCGHKYSKIETGVGLEYSKFCGVCGAAVSPPSLQIDGIQLDRISLQFASVSYIHTPIAVDPNADSESALAIGAAVCSSSNLSAPWKTRLTHCPLCGMAVELRNPTIELISYIKKYSLIQGVLCGLGIFGMLWLINILWDMVGFVQIQSNGKFKKLKESGWGMSEDPE